MVYFIQLLHDQENPIHACIQEDKTLCGKKLKDTQIEHTYYPQPGKICEKCERSSTIQLTCGESVRKINSFKKARQKLAWIHCIYQMLSYRSQLGFDLKNKSLISIVKSKEINFHTSLMNSVSIMCEKGDSIILEEVTYCEIEIAYLYMKAFLLEELKGIRN